jgi:hypothetical protein
LLPELVADWTGSMGDAANTWRLIEYLAPLFGQASG